MWFYYAYSHLEHDAVAVALRQLAGQLGTEQGITAELFMPRRDGTGPLGRIRHQISYLMRATTHIWVHAGPRSQIVTVDVPTGIGLVASALVSLRRGSHVSLVMDLYQFQSGEHAGPARRLRRAIDRRSLQRSGRIVTLGSCMRDTIERISGASAYVLPIWQDPAEIGETDAGALRAEFGIAEGTQVVLYSGNAGRQHPLVNVAAAVEALPADVDVLFLLAAHGAGADAVAARFTSSPRVRFVPAVARDRLSELLSVGALHVVALSADATGTCVPSKTYAAMAASRPILYVGDPAGQAALDVAESGSGVVVADDAARITAVLAALLARPDGLAAMGRAGRGFFVAERSASTQARRWKADIIDGERRTSAWARHAPPARAPQDATRPGA